MRIALLLSLVLSLAACGKKKAPQAPAAPEPAAAPASGAESDMENKDKPADADDAAPMSADPCEGGE